METSVRVVDLHIHSLYSDDGELSVEDISSLAVEANLSAVAIADHDSLGQIDHAIKIFSKTQVELIPALEISTVYPEDNTQQHILCYGAQSTNNDLISLCKQIREDRITLAKERLTALSRLGFQYNKNDINFESAQPPSATSVILAVLNNPENKKNPLLSEYISSVHSVMSFHRDYFAPGKPAFVPLRSISTKDAVSITRDAGFVPILAHPIFAQTEAILDKIVSYGVYGIEAWSSYHDHDKTEYYLSYAKRKGLIATAGSDFHGNKTKPNVKFGSVTGAYSIVEQIKKIYQ